MNSTWAGAFTSVPSDRARRGARRRPRRRPRSDRRRPGAPSRATRRCVPCTATREPSTSTANASPAATGTTCASTAPALEREDERALHVRHDGLREPGSSVSVSLPGRSTVACAPARLEHVAQPQRRAARHAAFRRRGHAPLPSMATMLPALSIARRALPTERLARLSGEQRDERRRGRERRPPRASARGGAGARTAPARRALRARCARRALRRPRPSRRASPRSFPRSARDLGEQLVERVAHASPSGGGGLGEADLEARERRLVARAWPRSRDARRRAACAR